jgi:hypothetical protein
MDCSFEDVDVAVKRADQTAQRQDLSIVLSNFSPAPGDTRQC